MFASLPLKQQKIYLMVIFSRLSSSMVVTKKIERRGEPGRLKNRL